MANYAELSAAEWLLEIFTTKPDVILAGANFKWGSVNNDTDDLSAYGFVNARNWLTLVDAMPSQKVKVLHALLWLKSSGFYPDAYDLTTFTRNQRISANTDHIEAMGAEFADDNFDIIDVWNEAVTSGGNVENYVGAPSGQGVTLTEIGQGFLDAATNFPGSKLYYNEFGIERDGTKLQGVIDMVTTLRQNGVRIDGIGSQCHLNLRDFPTFDELYRSFSMLKECVDEVRVSELDIRTGLMPAGLTTRQVLDAQRRAAEVLMNAATRAGLHDVCVWGISDAVSWLYDKHSIAYPTERPLPFTVKGNAKPFWAGLKR